MPGDEEGGLGPGSLNAVLSVFSVVFMEPRSYRLHVTSHPHSVQMRVTLKILRVFLFAVK